MPRNTTSRHSSSVCSGPSRRRQNGSTMGQSSSTSRSLYPLAHRTNSSSVGFMAFPPRVVVKRSHRSGVSKGDGAVRSGLIPTSLAGLE